MVGMEVNCLAVAVLAFYVSNELSQTFCQRFVFAFGNLKTLLRLFYKGTTLLDLGSHTGECEEFYLLVCNATYSGTSLPMFRRIILPPSLRSENKQRK